MNARKPPCTLIRAGRLFYGTGVPAIERAAVLVRDDRIEAVYRDPASPGAGPTDLRRPADALLPDTEVIDLPDCTILPGLIDAHVHLCLPGDGTPFPRAVTEPRGVVHAIAVRNAATALGAGITTLRDCGGFPDVLFALRRAIDLGYARGPRLVLAGWPITITGGHCHYFGGEADGTDGVRHKVREAIKTGVDYIKAMASGGGTPGTQAWRPAFSRDELRALVDEAHHLGYRAVLHCLCAEATDFALDAGADEIAHAWFLAGPDAPQRFEARVADRIAETGVPVCPTMSVGHYVRAGIAHLETPTPEDRAAADRWARLDAEVAEIVSRLRQRGVRFIAGSDAGWRFSPFDALPRELELMAEAGCSARECLLAATGAAAAALGLQAQIGTIRPGAAADLLAVDGRPDQDLAALQRVRLVMRAGIRIV
ncbi:MAG: amidohydrolase family protein [Armatimonadota bacterium]|nr:amidohydrolase family protein [Armatimonadota bacterium]